MSQKYELCFFEWDAYEENWNGYTSPLGEFDQQEQAKEAAIEKLADFPHLNIAWESVIVRDGQGGEHNLGLDTPPF